MYSKIRVRNIFAEKVRLGCYGYFVIFQKYKNFQTLYLSSIFIKGSI